MMKQLMQEILPNKIKSDVLEGAPGAGKPEPEIPAEGPNEEPEPAPVVDDTHQAPNEVPPAGEHVPVREEDRAVKEPPLR
jgi:hypothetical protein